MATTTPATPAGAQVNLPFSYYRSKGTSPPRHRRRGTTCERLVCSQTGKAQVVPFAFPFTTYYYTDVNPRGTTSLQSLQQDNNGTPATWTLVLFQQAIDRQDRTTEPKDASALLEPLEIQQPQQESLPLPDKESSQADDMPCRHPSIEATPAPAEEPRRDKPGGSSLLAGTNLRIAHLDTNICPIPTS